MNSIRYALFLLLPVLGCSAATLAPPADGTRHVVIIMVDGLRPDAITAAPAAHIQGLMAAGASSLQARVPDPPETLPSHITMATGLQPFHHGVTTNTDLGYELALPTIFSVVHAAGGHTGLYFGKSKLSALAPGASADRLMGPEPKGKHRSRGDIQKVAQSFAADFQSRPQTLAVVHLREPDWTGHHHGWMSPKYLQAVRDADAAVGIVLQAIADSGVAAATTVILSSDHGGEGTHHSANGSDATWLVPWICRTPGNAAGTTLRGQVQLVDTAATVLALLGAPALATSDGRVLTQCLPDTARSSGTP